MTKCPLQAGKPASAFPYAGPSIPAQVRMNTLNEGSALTGYVKPIVNELLAQMVGVQADFSGNLIKAKNANAARVHTMLVIGGCDPAEAGPLCRASGFTAKVRRTRSRKRR